MSAKSKTTTGRRRMKFLPEEDEKLRELVAKYGKSWNDIAKRLQGRNVRQCRERWKHYLSSDRAKSPWSNEEDLLLFQKFMELGPKWTKIAKFFDNRTDIQIKTRWMKRFGGCSPMIVPQKIQPIMQPPPPPVIDNTMSNTMNNTMINTINNSTIRTDSVVTPVQEPAPKVLQPIPVHHPTVTSSSAPPSIVPLIPDTGGTSLSKLADDVFYNRDQKMFYTFDDIPHQDVDMFPAENSDNLFNIYLDF